MTTTKALDSASLDTTGSIESWLAGRRADLQKKQTHEIPVPGFSGRLIGVYHSPSYKELRVIAKRHESLDSTEQELYGSADIIITACDRIYAKGEDGQTADLPKWGIDLARKFGIDSPSVDTARKAVLAIFDGNELNLVIHAGELVTAIQEAEPGVEEELEANFEEPTAE
jgi:hypothetical protein